MNCRQWREASRLNAVGILNHAAASSRRGQVVGGVTQVADGNRHRLKEGPHSEVVWHVQSQTGRQLQSMQQTAARKVWYFHGIMVVCRRW